MGVYIKGMEMPKDEYIDVRLFPDGTAITQTGRNPFYKEFRVVAVHPHGRLIDADALIAAHKEVCSRSMKFNLDLAPTVIEAEDGE